MKILVTGGAGFLGSHLCDRLLGMGHDVIAMDDFSTGSIENVRHLEAHPRFRLIAHDIRVPFHFDVDRIYNLACPASPPQYQRDPVGTTMTCVQGTLNCLELAAKTGARLLQASTSEVYGDPEVHPQPEDYKGCVNTVGPRACYDEGKRVAETLCMDYHRTRGVEVRIVRIFNTYGPRMSEEDGRVVSNFIVQALTGDDITIYGDGSQTRSFCFVDDLLEGMSRFMEADCGTGPMNIGNPAEFTVGELADLVLRLTGSRSRVVTKPLPVDDPKMRRPDISKARSEIGFVPRTPLDEGLKRTIAYFRERIVGRVDEHEGEALTGAADAAE